jgi:selenocysteine lyase/cysteine desulfurase
MSNPTHMPKDEFPILQHGYYANHAAIAPWPRATARAVAEFAIENRDIGPENYARWLLRETDLRQLSCNLLNAESADDIALLKNTTEGICTVANGIEWRKGDNVVLPLDEFPSNRLPWLALRQHGVEVREVDIRSTDEPEQALLDNMDKQTRLLAVSAVQWTDGLRLRLEILGDACRQGGVLFFVDAIQQLGALEMDVQACHIDFLAADGHKWMLAPEGIAIFYCRQGLRDRLTLLQHGWRMVDQPYHFNRAEWLPSQAASRFEAGSPNTLGQAGLHASLQLLLQVGMKNVEAAVRKNSLFMSKSLATMPALELVRPYEPGRGSGIVSFRMPGKKLNEIFRALKQKQLVCAVRGDSIRLSPHFYQAGKPLHDILNLIEDVVST